MEKAIQLISDLIEHFKLESREQETRCFYCGGPHKTVNCSSDKREEFIRQFLEMEIKSKRARQIMSSSISMTCYDEFFLDLKKYEPKEKLLP
ncbi:MAG: hypothetical protein KGY41_08415 [Desulfovermiculus sp.]|nr:hypothetical protein [Desulfovermiculus sp.]